MNIKEGDSKIKICSSVLEVMERYIQSGLLSLEAGGVLIGKENISNDDVVIKYITEPCKNDKRRYNRFIRKDKKHLDFFNEIYNSNSGIYRYVGEWHTHNEDVPQCSFMDLRNWKKIMKESPGSVSHFHIIVGKKAIRIWKVEKSSKSPELLETIYWKDVMASK